MRACTHNVLLVNQISCSREGQRERAQVKKMNDANVLPHMYLKLTYTMRECLRVYTRVHSRKKIERETERETKETLRMNCVFSELK